MRRLRCLDETLHGHQVSSYLRSIFFTAHRSSSHAVKHKTLLEDPLTRMLYCYLYSIIFLIKRKKKSNSEHSNSYAITKRGVTSSFYVVVAYYLCLDTVVIFFVNSIFCILLQRCANLWFWIILHSILVEVIGAAVSRKQCCCAYACRAEAVRGTMRKSTFRELCPDRRKQEHRAILQNCFVQLIYYSVRNVA